MLLVAGCAQLVAPIAAGVDVALTTPHHPVEAVTDCEPNWGFEDHGLVLFVASDAQLHELVRLRYWPALWAPPGKSQAACEDYLRTLSDLARRAQAEHARLFVLQLTDVAPVP